MIRELRVEDAELMLEWMHDKEICKFLRKDFANMTKEDAVEFIKNSDGDARFKHWAIVDGDNNYLGTISLKNINDDNKNAEFAIVTRKNVHGRGYSQDAIQQVLKYAFEDRKLNKVYLKVLSLNKRAINYYKRNGFVYEGRLREDILRGNEYYDVDFYSVLSREYFKNNAEMC